MAVTQLVQKNMDEWNRKISKHFPGNFAESSKIIGPDGVILHGLPGVETFWDPWRTHFRTTRARSTTSSVHMSGRTPRWP